MRVFISYKREDQPFAESLRQKLIAWGYETWLDTVDIPKGGYWRDEIHKGLQSSDVVIGAMSPQALDSRPVKNEWDWAIENGKRLILLMLHPCERAIIPPDYITINWIDFTQNQPHGFHQLELALRDSERPLYRKTSTPAPVLLELQKSNRAKMLQQVYDSWVEGVLNQTIQEGKGFTLGLEAAPHAVLQHRDYADYPMPSNMRIGQVFEDMHRELLILGAPGAGKTILLLQLARDLITRAQEDESLPTPVIFNLSSWAAQQLPFAEWLVEEMFLAYGVPRKVAREWIEHERLLLLLDGLDEVSADYRDACVEAINTFRRQYRSVDLVICSRIEEYESLAQKLDVWGAITLQPLDQTQIDHYLAAGDLANLRQVKAADPTLQEFASTPFLLNTMASTYRGLSAVSLTLPANQDPSKARSNHLFEHYIEGRLNDMPEGSRYSKRQVRHYLTWLGGKITTHKQTVFYIENMQPLWLQGRKRIINLVNGLIFGLSLGLLGWLMGGLTTGLREGVSEGLFLGAIGGTLNLIIRINERAEIKCVEMLTFRWSNMWSGLLFGLAFGVIGLLLTDMITGLFFGVFGGILAMLFGELFGAKAVVKTSESLISRTQPNQGIYRTTYNALKVSLVLLLPSLLLGIFIGSSHAPCDDSSGSLKCNIEEINWSLDFESLLINSVAFVSIIFLLTGLIYGGRAVILHIVLRFLLWREGSIPRNYAHFLNQMASLGILRKVGGGYIFVHRYLLEYFAELEAESK